MKYLHLTIVLLLIVWTASHFWREWALKRDYRRLKAVWHAATVAAIDREHAECRSLQAEYKALAEQFHKRWGYRP